MTDTPRPVVDDSTAQTRTLGDPVELTVPDLDGVPEDDSAEPQDADADAGAYGGEVAE